MPKDKGIAQAAHDTGCSEGGMRRLERKGIVHPVRDPWGRRLFGDDDIEAARRYLAEQAGSQQGAAA
jgi:DNA-binding transcriptional MerR regulator